MDEPIGSGVPSTKVSTEESSGLAGLSITAKAEGATTITVGTDTAKIKTAINDFIAEFNKAQSLIETNTSSTTNGEGKVTAGILANENMADEIGSRLRSTAYSVLSGFASTMDQLADIGISTSGTDNSLTLTDEEALDTALANNLAGVEKLFTADEIGVGSKLDKYLEDIIGDDGLLADKSSNLGKQIAAIDVQVSDLERVVQSNKERLTASFIAMETTQAQINQQLQFLAQRFGGGAAAAK